MSTIEKSPMVIPADWVPGPPQGSWTYNDYAALPDDGQRYEIVNGVLLMAPAPGTDHQSISMRFSYHLFVHVELAGLGRVFAAPTDVELGPKNVLQPDLLVVLNAHLNRVAAKRIIGAPDLVIELSSPSTAVVDRLTKYDIYAQAGVAEYWIAKPDTHTVEVLILEAGKYRSLGIFSGQQTLPSHIVPDFPVHVEQFFL
jgi:Uma2 family endonuclease